MSKIEKLIIGLMLFFGSLQLVLVIYVLIQVIELKNSIPPIIF